jgi:hypothetical protein
MPALVGGRLWLLWRARDAGTARVDKIESGAG